MEIGLELFHAASLEGLERVSLEVRRHIIKMITQAQGGHLGGSLSCVELLVALYFEVMEVDPLNPKWEERDRFVLSKGHASAALYAVLAERGFLPKEELLTYGRIGSRLQSHVDMSRIPGIDMSSGSPGQGLSIGAGMALGAKLDAKSYRTYVVLGDGEVQEGQVWETTMFAASKRLDNLTAILDYNKFQLSDALSEIVPVEPVLAKFQSFGWNVIEIDGHEMSQIIGSLRRAAMAKGRPTLVIAHTVKGKSISFMENRAVWHAASLTPEECERALAELHGQ